ncbi:membrane-associated protein, putative [Bodo saltans]|uniref:Membrane-associated protein, putative n=1 Tax=Bodo saltans TaxID=75058 RepID=A0A0S4JAS8_BODSA|nr:membrane-associated protein, putative [Bodo saltans]|eukprot:CUG87450.1 membrane-associated protein, putative [Bodo saltans]
MSLMTIVVCVSIVAIALWVLFAHRRRYGSARGGAALGIAASESSSYNNGSIEDGNGGVNNECLCRKCGAAALASVAVSEQSGWSGAFAEATLRRKRMWMAQRGEEFLRNVMFGRRSAGLGAAWRRISEECDVWEAQRRARVATWSTMSSVSQPFVLR